MNSPIASDLFHCERCRQNKVHYYSFKEVKWVCRTCTTKTEFKGDKNIN